MSSDVPHHSQDVLSCLRSGFFCVYLEKEDEVIKKYVSKCPVCNRIDQNFFKFQPTNIRFLQHRSIPVCFTAVSLDILGPIICKPTRNSRKRDKYWVLICLCLFSKGICMIPMDSASRDSVRLALTNLQARYSNISLILTDQGSQLNIDSDDQIFNKQIVIEQVPTNSQVLNVVESSYKTIKKMLKSMFMNKEKLTYPTLTILELIVTLEITSNLFNSKQIAGLNINESAISPNNILKPYISEHESDVMLEKFRNFKFSLDQQLSIFIENRKFYEAFVVILKKIIFTNNYYYFSKKPDGLQPVTGDVCLIKRQGGSSLKLCQITKIDRNIVTVNIMKNNKLQETKAHISILALIYRPNSKEMIRNDEK